MSAENAVGMIGNAFKMCVKVISQMEIVNGDIKAIGRYLSAMRGCDIWKAVFAWSRLVHIHVPGG